MGHKVHPNGFRLGVYRNWEAKWFAPDKEYKTLLLEDVRLRRMLLARLKNAGVARIETERSSSALTITLHTAKPGIVIGKGGTSVDQLRDELEKRTGKRVRVTIQEIKKPELSAQLVAENVAAQLEKRIAFRRAISEAINRADLARVVFRGHAQAALGPVSPANKFWFNAKLKPGAYSPDIAFKALQAEGFRLENGILKDKAGNAVVFSIITNAGNKYRERMATMIQEDLHKIGIQVNVVTLDFPSLIERMTQTFDYEAILLGLTNIELDPNGQMNVWLSSSENHQWNPSEKAPETEWEAEIDRLMRAQASSADPKKRKESFDRVQEIALEQAPFIYLVNRNALSAVAANVQGASPVILVPQTYWNVERLSVK